MTLQDRRHVAHALQAMRGADFALCSYAERGEPAELAAAHANAQRLVGELEHEIRARAHAVAEAQRREREYLAEIRRWEVAHVL